MEKHIHALFLHLLIPSVLSLLLVANAEADQARAMYQTFQAKNSESIPSTDIDKASSAVYLASQEGLKEVDRITDLPGQPSVGFQQYAGYVTVDPHAGRVLFYYFVESSEDPSSKPLVLWLNGGRRCSSLIGAMTEQGPFRVNSDGKTLFNNEYSWNNVANVIFLESPAGVGFSYSNTTSDYDHTGDISTSKDSYTFLINWLERFPEYKSRDFYITGHRYAGHYVPQLAHTILHHNRNATQTINLRGIAMGNAWIDDITTKQGIYDYLWTHALMSDQTYQGIHTYCNFTNTSTIANQCHKFMSQANREHGNIINYNIYAPLCHARGHINGSVKNFDPCSLDYVDNYLNLPEVQAALHAKPTTWSECSDFGWNDWEPTLLPTIRKIMNAGIRIWIYSGDLDSVVPVTSTKYSINSLKLDVKTPWKAWYTSKEVGGYVVVYDGLTFATVRGAGHKVPSNQPERALVLVSAFLQGSFPTS